MEQPEVRGSAALDATEPGAHDARREARVRYLALLACINSVSLGYQIGAVTVSNGLVKRHLNLSNAQLAAYEASVNIAAIAGAILSGLVSEPVGRRGVFLLSAFVFSAGSVVQALSWTYASLLVGILLVGLGVGIGLAIDPLYIAEISPPGGRGFFVTYSEAAISAGQLLGYVIALIIDASMGSCACAWRLMLGLGVVPAACLAYAVIFIMPESPRWLARHGREEEARKVLEDDLQWDATRAQAILEDVRAEAQQAPAAGQTWLGLLHLARTKPAVRRMLLVGVGTAVAQQPSGSKPLESAQGGGMQRRTAAGSRGSAEEVLRLKKLADEQGVLKKIKSLMRRVVDADGSIAWVKNENVQNFLAKGKGSSVVKQPEKKNIFQRVEEAFTA